MAVVDTNVVLFLTVHHTEQWFTSLDSFVNSDVKGGMIDLQQHNAFCHCFKWRLSMRMRYHNNFSDRGRSNATRVHPSGHTKSDRRRILVVFTSRHRSTYIQRRIVDVVMTSKLDVVTTLI